MTTNESTQLQRFIEARTQEGNDLVHNGCHAITPLHLIDTIVTAKDAINYSNYDCANLDRALTYLLKYWSEHNIPLGEDIPEGLKQKLEHYEN